MGDRFLSMSEVLDRICLSKTHLYRKINAGQFPRPVPLGPQKVAFLESEVEAWMSDRLRAREREEGAEARRERARYSVSGAEHVTARADAGETERDDVRPGEAGHGER